MQAQRERAMAEPDKRRDKRLSLAPLTTEEALRGLMQAGPPPKDADQRGKEKVPPKERRHRRAVRPRANPPDES